MACPTYTVHVGVMLGRKEFVHDFALFGTDGDYVNTLHAIDIKHLW